MGCAVQRAVHGGLLFARRDVHSAAAINPAFGLFDIMHFAVHSLGAANVQIVAGHQCDIAGADELCALADQVIAGGDLDVFAAEGGGDGEAVVTLVMGGGAFAVEHPMRWV